MTNLGKTVFELGKLLGSYTKCQSMSLLRSNMSSNNMSPKYRPSKFQKKILVWTKKYKSAEEIPEFVAGETIERARSEARIKLSNVLMLMTALASLGAIFAGKAAAKRGESVQQQNLDWHKQYKEDYDKQQEALAK